jgi:hypothetical protein
MSNMNQEPPSSLWDRISRHPLWSAIIAGVVLLIIGGIAHSIFSDSSSRSPAGAKSTSSLPASASSSPPASPSSTPQSNFPSSEPSSAPTSQYLGSFDPVANSGSLLNGTAQVNGNYYPNSIVLYLNPGPASVEYNLGRQWKKLDMTLGLKDDSTGNQNVQFQLRADGRTIYTQIFTLGQSRHVTLNVSGVLRLELDATLVSNYAGPVYAVWGSANLLS